MGVKLLAGGVSFCDTWNQNVLIFVEESLELQHANGKAREVLLKSPAGTQGAFSAPSHRPHLSLMYGDHPTAKREEAAEWVKHEAAWANAGAEFTADALHLWESVRATEFAKKTCMHDVSTNCIALQCNVACC